MKYLLPDSQDLVDPSFDFERESRSSTRLRQRDDLYAHELFSERPFDGLLVSKGIVDGTGGSGGRYSMAQRARLLREGAPDFFRLEGGYRDELLLMGDCGSFTYASEDVPPYTVDDVLRFYGECDFDMGVSVDHVILGYDAKYDERGAVAPEDYRRRQQLTLDLASEFLRKHKKTKPRFYPLGVAQGWSPKSYAAAVTKLQRMGYDYIAVGGMVPLKTPEIIASLAAMNDVRKPGTRFHLLGITRLEELQRFREYGSVSFDSTSPLRQAFKDDRDNYYTLDRTYTALRIPQIEGNAKLQKLIRAGRVNHDEARRLEKAALKAVGDYERGKVRAQGVAKVLVEYEQMLGTRKDHTAIYEETLAAAPWRDCSCDVCQAPGHHVILFRGAERNRRRGLHNVWTFYRRLQRRIGSGSLAQCG